MHYNKKRLNFCLPFVSLKWIVLNKRYAQLKTYALNTLGHFLLKARKSIFHGLSFKQRDDHTCFIIKYSVTVLVLTIGDTKMWNRRMEQKAEELYEDSYCTSKTTFP